MPNSNSKNTQHLQQFHSTNSDEQEEFTFKPGDFRQEIERKYNKSVVNKTYKYPRRQTAQISMDDEASLQSIKNIYLYNLASQNKNFLGEDEEEEDDEQELQNEDEDGQFQDNGQDQYREMYQDS